MNLREHISAVEIILSHSRASKDSRISFPFLINRWNTYRSVHIRDSHRANAHEYDTSLFQDLAAIHNTLRSLQDDPGFPASCTNMGKCTIPAVVSMVNNAGLVSVTTMAKSRIFNPCNISELVKRMQLENYKEEYWYSKVGNVLWTYPYHKEINVVAILDNPLEGWMLNTEDPVNGKLIYRTDYNVGELYKVINGVIVHDGVTYTAGSVFEATRPNWTGLGKIGYVTRKRALTIDDEYPMSSTMAENILMKILTQDFKLEEREIADIRNNMKDDSLVMV